MKSIAKMILEESKEELGVLKAMFQFEIAKEDRDVDKITKLAESMARIKRGAYQVEAQAMMVATMANGGMAARANQPGGNLIVPNLVGPRNRGGK